VEAIIESLKAPVEGGGKDEDEDENPVSPQNRNKNKERKDMDFSIYNQKQLRGDSKKRNQTQINPDPSL